MFNNKFWRKIGFKDKQIKGQKKNPEKQPEPAMFRWIFNPVR